MKTTKEPYHLYLINNSLESNFKTIDLTNFTNAKKKGEQWPLRFQRVTSIVQIASIGKAPEILIPICIRPPYMTAMADATTQKITEVQQAAQWHNVQILKPILTQDNIQKGQIKKESSYTLAALLLCSFRNNDLMIL